MDLITVQRASPVLFIMCIVLSIADPACTRGSIFRAGALGYSRPMASAVAQVCLLLVYAFGMVGPAVQGSDHCAVSVE